MNRIAALKPLLGSLMFLAAPALADSAASIASFTSKMTAARAATSPGGTAVVRSEIAGALNGSFFLDGHVDAQERAYLATQLGDALFLQGLTGQAKKYLTDFHELNDAADREAPLTLGPVAGTTAELFGASGALSRSARVKEGYIPNGQGVANQVTLSNQYTQYFGGGYDYPLSFEPINPRELIAKLQASTYFGTPSQDEVDGALAYVTEISRNSNRLYIAYWHTEGRGGPGEAAGFVVAAVSTDRRFVRMLEVLSWST
ncbi:hypothetical protein [Melittangium boletus]|uniref:Uncharacterized protein n=1 Tax=Melittangium boletus DSM 14713 TaxID=1294270 RepID=A0A250IFV5_9BACT|nr:hypothetical protein [Melittangium boletus]ATB30113.1 hypothetical protein MEBOL_003568 [Melittangium boletus DSM 14713]